ncbi:MAG: RNA-binding domain-containing protein [Lachnospirales bacterium]
MKYKETEKIELKEIYTDDLKKEIIAFCNTNGGVIYIGVNDSGEIVGLQNIDETASKITNSIRDSIKPDITMFVSLEILEEDNKSFIKINIDEGSRKPYYLSDKGLKSSGVFVRQGTSKAGASEDSIRNMIKLSDGNSFELNRSLEQGLTFECLEMEFKKRNLDFGQMQQKNLSIISSDDMYTNLGLLCSDECKHSIKYAIFQGTDKSVFKDRKEFNGSIFSQLNEVYKAIDFYNGTKATFNELLREDKRDYPVEAIREALLNAIVHRDYSFSGSIIINQYEDKIEFVSLGGLVSGLSLDAIYNGASQSRNEKLANLFYRMKLIESYGTGVSKIKNSYKGNEGQPEFYSAEGIFKVTLPNLNYSGTIKAKAFVDKHKNIYISDTQKILNYIKVSGKITRKDVEKLCGVKSTKASKLINELVVCGDIARVGVGKDIKYVLVSK